MFRCIFDTFEFKYYDLKKRVSNIDQVQTKNTQDQRRLFVHKMFLKILTEYVNYEILNAFKIKDDTWQCRLYCFGNDRNDLNVSF